jgi:16S rRNA (cytosine1402-N4)-methyltransferase
VPVLVEAVIDVLSPRDDALYVDGTFGAGGYSAALLAAANCRVVAIDRDPDAVRRGRELARAQGGRLAIIEGNFGDMERLLASPGSMTPAPIAGIALDLGVSSIQLDTAERGFSFRFDGPLDMRMSGAGQTAADLVATLAESDLARLIHEFGEERFARRIARAIAAARQRQPIGRTLELAQIVRAAVPKAAPGLDPATRTFQALRIAVNDELGELDRALAAAERLLMPGGRLAIVSFHSLEDRRVKDFLRQRSDRAPRISRHDPVPTTVAPPSFQLLHRRALKPDIVEIDRNPRARAARLRAAERTAASPWPPSRDRQQRHAA